MVDGGTNQSPSRETLAPRVPLPDRPVRVEGHEGTQDGPRADLQPRARPGARIALAHDWLCGYRGGEAVLERLARLAIERFAPLPGDHPPVYTMFDDRGPMTQTPTLAGLARITPPLARLPGAVEFRRWLVPLYPRFIESLSSALTRDHARRPIDLLVSSSSCAVKGLRSPPGVPHVCYCHAPARYFWSQREVYESAGGLRAAGLRKFGEKFRAWDRATAANVTTFVANSAFIAAQIKQSFDRDATVVHPPVRTNFFTPDAATPRESFWLVVSALEPYKRVDLAIKAANATGQRLVIAGNGSEWSRLRAMAGASVRFVGRVDDEALRRLYRRAAVLIHPQVEDFGIAAVEAQACGLPVAAFRAGGALETVIENKSGVFFDEPSVASLVEAIAKAPKGGQGPAEAGADCRRSAERFTAERFDAAMEAVMLNALTERPNS